jgi:aminoglycoside 3-N-acetyltransferase
VIAALTAAWRACGIERGDIVLLHSAIGRTMRALKRENAAADANTLLYSFIDAVGAEGTLLLPLFNFGFAKGEAFDMASTPSKMGALTEAARLHPDAIRTGHPIYSFAAIGKHARAFEGVNNRSGYGEDSPFGILRRLGGKIAALDLDDQSSMTFYHHVEEMKAIPYRYFKTFFGSYTDLDRTLSMQAYTLYVRDIAAGVLTHVNPCGEAMWRAGLYKGERPGTGAGLRVIDAKAMFSFVSEVIESDRAFGMLYALDSEQKRA